MSRSGRRRLVAIVVLAAVLHTVGIARTILPAQDGLKFIRIARQFQSLPPADVIRRSDQHPLYPALIALAEPLVAWFAGDGPDAWRIAAQAVAAVAATAAIIPLYSLARALFDDRVAALAGLMFVLFPLPFEVGHDTLSDSLALCATLTALWLGARALVMTQGHPGWAWPVASGLVAGVGYLARPEVALVPLALWMALVLVAVVRGSGPVFLRQAGLVLSTLGVAFLTLVGGYALVKGEVSEKLALRYGVGIAGPNPTPGPGPRPRPAARKARQWVPRGLDDPRWNFAPKEESAERERERSGADPDDSEVTPRTALGQLIGRWSEGLGGIFGAFAIWGALRARVARNRNLNFNPEHAHTPPPRLRLLLTVYLVLYAAVLVRHMVVLGYLSDRHVLPLVALALPWAAAGTDLCARRIADVLGWPPRRARRIGTVALSITIVGACVVLLDKPGHHSRWGHWAAGRWLHEHAGPADAVLDTRGWAAFVSDRPSYDYWHVRQALTDSRLAYVVVGDDELSASSRRGATLRAILAYAASGVAAFPEEKDGHGIGVRVFRFHRPDSWEGLRP
jgi:4-amino-4-deoxy-L-arabinose transferase-like glycosyltransferase